MTTLVFVAMLCVFGIVVAAVDIDRYDYSRVVLATIIAGVGAGAILTALAG